MHDLHICGSLPIVMVLPWAWAALREARAPLSRPYVTLRLTKYVSKQKAKNRKPNTRPVAGGGAGGARAPPEISRLELISATKVEFCY